MKCTRKDKYKNTTEEQLEKLDKSEYLDNHFVYADHLQWEPLNGQRFENTPKIVHDKILIAQLAENQEIEFEAYCTKNNGMMHTKWSPVATAYYRLEPHIEIKEDIKNEQAERMNELCPAKVFGIKNSKN